LGPNKGVFITMRKTSCKVLLDTSTLMLVYDGVDPIELIDDAIEAKCEYLVPEPVIDELIRLSTQGIGFKSKAARLALKYLSGKVSVISLKGKKFKTADDFIKEYVKLNPDVIVATLDEDLKNYLKKLGIRIITWWFSKRKFIEI